MIESGFESPGVKLRWPAASFDAEPTFREGP